jgi:hypothetical protein
MAADRPTRTIATARSPRRHRYRRGPCLEANHPPACYAIGVEYRRDKIRLAQQRIEPLLGVVADAGMLPLRDARKAPLATAMSTPTALASRATRIDQVIEV